MIKIDFHGSTHGNFLEYVTNVYIMQTTASKTSIFQVDTGSAHAVDDIYRVNRIVRCGHYSNYNIPIPATDKVIRIIIDPYNDSEFYIASTNLMYKAGDVGFEKQMINIPEEIRCNPVAYRNNWYSKFNERDLYHNHYCHFNDIPNDIFEFNFFSFFCFSNFSKELNRLAFFLDQTFFPDESLVSLWEEFIQRNQGWQSHVKCGEILKNIFHNRSMNIDCTVMEEGWLNYNLTKICRIYEGTMFESPTYPENTKEVYKEIQTHLTVLRNG